MNEWNKLSMKDRAAYIKLGIDNGITDLATIRDTYNKYAEGGSTKWTMLDETNYLSWKDKLPDNLKYTDENEYDLRGAYKAGMEPQWNNKDKSYHLGSRDPYSGRILKSPHHPTYLEALITDASMGYYPSIDNKGNTYTNTWRGNKFDEGGYVRETNNNPIAFDEEGNLVDLITGEKGTMMLPNFNVYGHKDVADFVYLKRLNNLINQSEINPFTGETRVIGLERTYPEFELLGFKDLASPIFNSLKKGVTYSAAKLGNKTAQSKIIADMLDNSTLNNTLLTPISSRLITYIPNTPAPSSNTFTGFNDMRAYSEFVNRLDRDYAKAYLEGDIETGLRMWDNWFKYRTPNNKAIDALGNPIKTYHTVGDSHDPSFTIFDTNIEGRPTAIYSTDNPIMSASYSHKPVDETVLNSNLDHIKSIYKARTKLRKRDFKTDYLKAKESNFLDTFFTDRIDKKLYINDLLKIKQEEAIALNNMRKSYSPERRKELYLNLENPLEIEGYRKSWKDIPVILGRGLEKLSLSKNIAETREFANKHGIYFDGPDDILYLSKPALEDEYLYMLGKEYNIKNPHFDNIDDYPTLLLDKMKEFGKTLDAVMPSKGRMSTRDIEKLIRYLDGTNFDSAIIRDIGDWGGAAKPKLMFNEETGGYNTGTVFESLKPSQLKSTAPFTFDDKGKLIPLSRRADFNNPDMRYSLLPIGLTIGGATYLNQRNKNK